MNFMVILINHQIYYIPTKSNIFPIGNVGNKEVLEGMYRKHY